MGFHPEDQVRVNSKQCLHQGNGTKNVAIVWYNQVSDLWFSPWISRTSNRSHHMLSPPLASIPVAAYAHGLDDVLRSHGESWVCCSHCLVIRDDRFTFARIITQFSFEPNDRVQVAYQKSFRCFRWGWQFVMNNFIADVLTEP